MHAQFGLEGLGTLHVQLHVQPAHDRIWRKPYIAHILGSFHAGCGRSFEGMHLAVRRAGIILVVRAHAEVVSRVGIEVVNKSAAPIADLADGVDVEGTNDVYFDEILRSAGYVIPIEKHYVVVIAGLTIQRCVHLDGTCDAGGRRRIVGCQVSALCQIGSHQALLHVCKLVIGAAVEVGHHVVFHRHEHIAVGVHAVARIVAIIAIGKAEVVIGRRIAEQVSGRVAVASIYIFYRDVAIGRRTRRAGGSGARDGIAVDVFLPPGTIPAVEGVQETEVVPYLVRHGIRIAVDFRFFDDDPIVLVGVIAQGLSNAARVGALANKNVDGVIHLMPIHDE